MSDESVRSALRSDASLVVVEAPAGCGKTFQGADFAREIAGLSGKGRLLIVTHTHAACTVFANRTQGTGSRVEIRTIDSIIGQIAATYHAGLGLPQDIPGWIRQRKDGYAELAVKVGALLRQHPMIAATLARRHPIVVCDEHQDSSGDQHSIIMALHAQGIRLRVFADHMQAIFKPTSLAGACPPYDLDNLKGAAQYVEELDHPHRWERGSLALGEWVLKARRVLKSGGKIDLRTGLPTSVDVVVAENHGQRNLTYMLLPEDRRRIDAFEKKQESLLILTHYKEMARSFRSFFGRRIPLWEGHTRDELEKLVNSISNNEGDPEAIAKVAGEFVRNIGKGFSAAAFCDRFVQEARERCPKGRTGKKLALIQELARPIVDEPNHRGVSKMLYRLNQLTKTNSVFSDVKIDCSKEFWDAIHLGKFENIDTGLAEITHRRTYTRPKPPEKAISTIHKAKGLECESVILMPCDAKTFPDKPEVRCLLYVALSRATSRLMLVVSRNEPSPIFRL
jgi:DNA helicase-2/ATP-dependent DNA helicase PcrA